MITRVLLKKGCYKTQLTKMKWWMKNMVTVYSINFMHVSFSFMNEPRGWFNGAFKASDWLCRGVEPLISVTDNCIASCCMDSSCACQTWCQTSQFVLIWSINAKGWSAGSTWKSGPHEGMTVWRSSKHRCAHGTSTPYVLVTSTCKTWFLAESENSHSNHCSHSIGPWLVRFYSKSANNTLSLIWCRRE